MMQETLNTNKFRNDEDYYNFINYVKKQFNSHEITEVEKNKIIQLATLEESIRRKKLVEETNKLFRGRNLKEGEIGYYQQCINDFVDDKYIKCEYSLLETREAINCTYSPFIFNINISDVKLLDSITKNVYDDLKNNELDLLKITSDELYERYCNNL